MPTEIAEERKSLCICSGRVDPRRRRYKERKYETASRARGEGAGLFSVLAVHVADVPMEVEGLGCQGELPHASCRSFLKSPLGWVEGRTSELGLASAVSC